MFEIVYVLILSIKIEDKIKIVKWFVVLIYIDIEFLKERDLCDYWIVFYLKKVVVLFKEFESNLKGVQVYKF